MILLAAVLSAGGLKGLMGYACGIHPGLQRVFVTPEGRQEVWTVIRWDSPHGYVYYTTPDGRQYAIYPDLFITGTSPASR